MMKMFFLTVMMFLLFGTSFSQEEGLLKSRDYIIDENIKHTKEEVIYTITMVVTLLVDEEGNTYTSGEVNCSNCEKKKAVITLTEVSDLKANTIKQEMSISWDVPSKEDSIIKMQCS